MHKFVFLALALTAAPAWADEVRIPLSEWSRSQDELTSLREANARRAREPAVIVGETLYEGRSDGRSLNLTLTLRAQLANSDQFKTLPVVGANAVIVSAKHGDKAIALSVQGGHWVWHTRARGPVELTVALVIPPRGPRGSIEYGFDVVESPVTTLSMWFPAADLSPQVAKAVSTEVTPKDGGTQMQAILRPTNAIHIVGFKDIDVDGTRAEAKLYAETLNLVSLGDDSVELFSVIDVTILYAPARKFRVELPTGFEVVSADGEGAFSYTVETIDHHPVLVGETAFGMRQHYEISLRLKRGLGPDEARVRVPVPRLLDVERNTGFVAVEIPGKLSIESVDGEDLVAIDVRELPGAMVESSVTPLVSAFRYAGKPKPSWLMLARYPEKALAAGGIDHVRATSVVTADGRMMSDLTFTIRNSFQQHLVLDLGDERTVKSAVLGGAPIKPSRDERGRTLLPLMRSRQGPNGLEPFTVQLVYEQRLDPLGGFGQRQLSLPRLEVPVSSMKWSLYIPGPYDTTSLSTAISPQDFVKNAGWHGRSIWYGHSNDDGEVQGEAVGAGGAMPVRLRLPRAGQRLSAEQFWIDTNEPIQISFAYARHGWVRAFYAGCGLVFLGIFGAVIIRRAQPGWLARLKLNAFAIMQVNLHHGRTRLRASWTTFSEQFEARRGKSWIWAVTAAGSSAAWLAFKMFLITVASITLFVLVTSFVRLLQNPL